MRFSQTLAATLATVGLLAAVAVPAASANRFVSKQRAQAFARDYVHKRYHIGRYRIGAYCQPDPGHYNPRYVYHRWRCGWGLRNGCGGVLRIKGSRTPGWYYYARVLRGLNCS